MRRNIPNVTACTNINTIASKACPLPASALAFWQLSHLPIMSPSVGTHRAIMSLLEIMGKISADRADSSHIRLLTSPTCTICSVMRMIEAASAPSH